MAKYNSKYIIISVLLIVITLLSFTNKYTVSNSLKTIILDAGHGGKDPGANCYNRECTEAQITLGITLKLGKIIKDSMPDVKIEYTRTDDSYPTLKYRTSFANEKNGDLFVSIHCNEASNRTAQGLETYVWIPNKNDQKTNAIAKAENAQIYNDSNYVQNYGNGLDINSAEFIARAKLHTKKYFTRSITLAGFIQEAGVEVGRNDRNVKQRGVGIWVLQATAMPSVLVETGYISNPDEAAYLNSEDGQQEMAMLIAKAIKRYKDEIENKKNNPTQSEENTVFKLNAILQKKYAFIV